MENEIRKILDETYYYGSGFNKKKVIDAIRSFVDKGIPEKKDLRAIHSYFQGKYHPTPSGNKVGLSDAIRIAMDIENQAISQIRKNLGVENEKT